MSAPTRALLLAWVAVQVTVPLWRVDARQGAPFSSRFSWSMFAGRPIARCSHAIAYRTREGLEAPLPLPPARHPARRILSARTPEEFTVILPLLTSYADRDEVAFEALDDLLRRHKRAVDGAGLHTLISTLDCRTLDGRSFRRTLTLQGAPIAPRTARSSARNISGEP